jgi:hypothetical protein
VVAEAENVPLLAHEDGRRRVACLDPRHPIRSPCIPKPASTITRRLCLAVGSNGGAPTGRFCGRGELWFWFMAVLAVALESSGSMALVVFRWGMKNLRAPIFGLLQT